MLTNVETIFANTELSIVIFLKQFGVAQFTKQFPDIRMTKKPCRNGNLLHFKAENSNKMKGQTPQQTPTTSNQSTITIPYSVEDIYKECSNGIVLKQLNNYRFCNTFVIRLI